MLLFLGTECPVSNGYAPEYRRLAETYAGKGVLLLRHPPRPRRDARRSPPSTRPSTACRSRCCSTRRRRCARQAGVKVVPEAVVLSPKGSVLYRGRIDDLYTPDGKRREEPKTRDLEEALQAVLAGKPPPVAQTKAFGCPLPQPVK